MSIATQQPLRTRSAAALPPGFASPFRDGMVAASHATPSIDCDAIPVSPPMHRRIAIRLKHAALKAARPARRRVVHALRHHAVRARRAARPLDGQASAGLLRSWFRALVSVLRTRRAAQRFSLRALLVKPAVRRVRAAQARFVHQATNRRPRRLSASAGWFAFAAR